MRKESSMVSATLVILLPLFVTFLEAANVPYQSADPSVECPGYGASNVEITDSGLTADLTLSGAPCNIYGADLTDLILRVTYETDTRLHVLIQDVANDVYQVPESVFPRPEPIFAGNTSPVLQFNYSTKPFSFSVSRRNTGEVLFDTSAASLIFESQYLRLRTKLPDNPNLYGLGEHSDPLRLNTTDYIRTLWSQDSYGIPHGTNLYGNHPVYFEHRLSGTHAVFLLNSNGMDVVINRTAESGQYLEYNTLGGVFDFYFVAGPSPIEVSQQYAQIVGLPAMMPYWALGFHNCRYGYQDAYEVAEVVYNYSQAGIPLETMWTDIDYMNERRVFSLDPHRYPLAMMQQLVHHLHTHDQHYVLMVDPAVAYQPYPPFERGVADKIFLYHPNGSIWEGVVWPGVSAFPDWFSANISKYWTGEFADFFSPLTGVDIDALWIDMNEPSDFPCNFPCDNPVAAASGYPPSAPPVRFPPRHLPGWPCDFQPLGTDCEGMNDMNETMIFLPSGYNANLEPPRLRQLPLPYQFPESRRRTGQQFGLTGRDLLYPKYAIHNKAAYKTSWNAAEGGISNHTVNTNVWHQNGLVMYDTHNLYGTMMSTQSREAMLLRRPGIRPMVITRSTFAGAGAAVGHWLGDNLSDWPHYRESIRMMLGFTAIYQVPMVGSDVCGYAQNTTEELCARWAMLGAFGPFYRNHNTYPPTISQELYRWPVVRVAARRAIDIRYRLLDYLYTALWRQSIDGIALVTSPVWFHFPADPNTFALELQYFFGPSIMIAPVVEEGLTSVEVYFPGAAAGALFYDWFTHQPVLVPANGGTLILTNQSLTDVPLFVLGGAIVPLRVRSAMTTAALRQQDFELLIAVGADGTARGQLYLDDGVSLVQDAGYTFVDFVYAAGTLTATGRFDCKTHLGVVKVTMLGCAECGTVTMASPINGDVSYVFGLNQSLTGPFTLDLLG